VQTKKSRLYIPDFKNRGKKKAEEEKSKRWWAVVMGLMILSQFAHGRIGCGISPTWACQRYWIWNLLIGGIQSAVYIYWKWRKKEET